MKSYRLLSLLFSIGAAAAFIASICLFAADSEAPGIVFLCTGSALLCFGSVFAAKLKK